MDFLTKIVLQWGNGFMYQFIKPFAEPVPSVWTNQGDAPLKAGDQITGKIQNGFAKYGKFFELCSKKACHQVLSEFSTHFSVVLTWILIL